jgi:PKD repeat protein
MRLSQWILLAALAALVLASTGCALLDPPPTANFTWTPTDPLARSSVQFTDLSTDEGFPTGGGVTSWSWDFGDSGASASPSPTHEYPRSGVFTVRLTVRDASGNEASVSKSITVRPSLDGIWSGVFDDSGFPLPLTLFIQHSASGGIGGTGNFGTVSLVISSASLTGSQVTLAFPGSLVLSGTLDFSERGMSGTWSVGGAIGFGWNVQLQN